MDVMQLAHITELRLSQKQKKNSLIRLVLPLFACLLVISPLLSAPINSNDSALIANIQKNMPFKERVSLQRALILTGHFLGTAHGEINLATIRAIKSFQKSQGLEASGLWSEDLWSPLSRAAAKMHEWGGYAPSKPILEMGAYLPFNLLGKISKSTGNNNSAKNISFSSANKKIYLSVWFENAQISDSDLKKYYGFRKENMAKPFNGSITKITWSIFKNDWFAINAKNTDLSMTIFTRGHLIKDQARSITIAIDNNELDRLRPFAIMMLNDFRPEYDGLSVAETEMPPELRPKYASLQNDPAPQQKATQPSSKPSGTTTGTGFFVSQNDNSIYVITNSHVVTGCKTIEVQQFGGISSVATVKARDSINDLAVLEVKRNADLPQFSSPNSKEKIQQHITDMKNSWKAQHPELTNEELNFLVEQYTKTKKFEDIRTEIFGFGIRLTQLRLGEQVAAFGFPLNGLLSRQGNFTLGYVTATSGILDDSRFAQISTPVQPGNSGGPLIDQNGNVVGVVTSKLNALELMKVTGGDIPQNVNFAVKSAILTNFLEANKINYTSAKQDLATLKPEEIAEQAEKASVLLICRN